MVHGRGFLVVCGWLVIVLAMLASGQGVAKAQTCRDRSECGAIPDVDCLDGWCRTSSHPPPLVPSLDVSLLDLKSPTNLAQLTRGTFDVEFSYPQGAAQVRILVTRSWPVYASNGKLSNAGDVVWHWDSAWEDRPLAVVPFGAGKVFRLVDKQCKLQRATPLEPGVYHWAVLGLSREGQVSHQSEVRTFTVGPESITGRHCDNSLDCRSAGSSVCYATQHYCILRCASDRDCFDGTRCDLGTRDTIGFPYGVCRRPGLLCACTKDEFCDNEGDGALSVCFRIRNASQGAGGCDCPGGTGGGSNPVGCVQPAGVLGLVGLNRLLRKRRGKPNDIRRERSVP